MNMNPAPRSPSALRALRTAASVLYLAAAGVHAAAPQYAVSVVKEDSRVDIGGGAYFKYSFYGLSMNDAGKVLVVESTSGAQYVTRYAVYSKNGERQKDMTCLDYYGAAVGINNFGDVARYCDLQPERVTSSVVKGKGFDAEIHGFDDPGDVTDGFFADAWAYGLSDNGYVVGAASGEIQVRYRGFIRNPDDSMLEIGTFGGERSEAKAVNSKGVAVGWAETSDGSQHAFKCRSGLLIDIGTLGGKTSYATDINDAGQVLGSAEDTTGMTKAFIHQGSKLTAIPAPADAQTYGEAINRRGWAVGRYRMGSGESGGFLYDGANFYKINELLAEADADWKIEGVSDINNHGWILAKGRRKGAEFSAVILLRPLQPAQP
ncbi:hypothetical protein AACH06_15375 [Ideonella sp. DXS29W]|uniref:HAF repeat-containing protein n=1 Tax=Ideonella lacteola TaxID=2984193 RepID=A0ABU9BRY0_9BURK